MAARKKTAKTKKDGTPRRKPGPKKGWKQQPSPVLDARPRRRPGRPRKDEAKPLDELNVIGPRTYYLTVVPEKTPGEKPDVLQAGAPCDDTTTLPDVIAWIATYMHQGKMRGYKITNPTTDRSIAVWLDDEGKRTNFPGVVVKADGEVIWTVPKKPAEKVAPAAPEPNNQGGSASPALDADAVQREAIINSEIQTGVPALR